MSGEAVIEAVGSFLRGKSSSKGDGSVPFLTNVFDYPAKFTPEMDFFDQDEPGTDDGGVIFLYVSQESERRTAFGGLHSGEKKVVYAFNLECFFRSNEKKAQVAGLKNRQMLDGIKAAIRSDRLAGAPGLVFQWGEGTQNQGEVDIRVRSYYPRIIQGRQSVTQTYSSVSVSVVEFLTND